MSHRRDLKVSPLTANEISQFVISHRVIELENPVLLLNHNLHSLYLFETDSCFRSLYARAEHVVIDGFPVALLARFGFISNTSRGSSNRLRVPRTGSTDWIDALIIAGYDGGKIALIGGTPQSNKDATAAFRKLLPKCRVAGWNGYDEAANLTRSEFKALRNFGPSLILVGMGMPLQERFILDGLHKLPPAVVATVGGAFDYYIGVQKLAPRFLGRIGLEWLWRLALSPRRLGRRYLIEPFLLLFLWFPFIHRESVRSSR